MSNRNTAAALEYHEATKHSERSVRASRHFLDFENQPLAFKIYRDLEAIPLPQSFPANDIPALEGISPAVPGPVDHHVTRACDRGRGVPDRRTLLADLATTRTCAM